MATRRTQTEDTIGDIAVALASAPPVAAFEPAAALAPPPKEKTCDIKLLVSASALALLQSFPENATARTMVEGYLKQPIPPDKLSFNDIVEWVEYNPQFSGKQVPPPTGSIQFIITKEGYERGDCRYNVETYGDQKFELKDVDLLRIAHECDSDDGPEFWDKLSEFISEHEGIILERSTNSDLSDYQPDDDGDNGWRYHNHEAVIATVRTRLFQLAPDLAARLGI